MKYCYPFLLTLFFASFSSLTYAQLNHYYGNLHSHTSYSDGSKDSLTSGLKTPYQAYTFAKASLHFDFLGVSEHNHYSAGMNLPDYHRGLQQADSANEDGTFVALYGMEWGTISSGGHVLVYGSSELMGWEPGNYDEYVGVGNYQQLWNSINAKPSCFGMCAHPNNSDFNNIRNVWSASADKALTGTAFRSGPAFSTNISYSNPSNSSFENYYKALLQKGYHVGPTYDHDNHNTTFGRTTEGRLVALAPSLSQADLMQAFRNRSFYASDDWNAQVTLSANNEPMGSIVYQPTSTCFISATLSDLDLEGFTSFQILKGVIGNGQNAQVLASLPAQSSAASVQLSFSDNIPSGDSAYYYVSVTQNDGDRIITAPIWYKNGVLLASAQELSPLALAVWPNPVSTTLTTFTVAAPLTGLITILDAVGKIIKQVPASPLGSVITTEGLSKGLYIIRYSTTDQLPVSTRLIVE